MSSQRHYYRMETRYAPGDLFKTLKNTCGDNRFRRHKPSFDFDWMKRKVEIQADSQEGAEVVLEALIERVNRKAGRGLLLPGEPARTENGRITIPVGVLIQTPDIYTEVLVESLRECGVKGIQFENGGEGLSLPPNSLNRALEYGALIASFPLPEYLSVKDEGIR